MAFTTSKNADEEKKRNINKIARTCAQCLLLPLCFCLVLGAFALLLPLQFAGEVQ